MKKRKRERGREREGKGAGGERGEDRRREEREGERRDGEENLLGEMEHEQIKSLKSYLCVISVHVYIKLMQAISFPELLLIKEKPLLIV